MKFWKALFGRREPQNRAVLDFTKCGWGWNVYLYPESPRPYVFGIGGWPKDGDLLLTKRGTYEIVGDVERYRDPGDNWTAKIRPFTGNIP